MPEAPRLVYLEWEDASSCWGPWMNAEEAIAWPDKALFDARTVGWLLHEDEKCLVLAQNVTGAALAKGWPPEDTESEAYQTSSLMRIPRGMVRKLVDLTIPA